VGSNAVQMPTWISPLQQLPGGQLGREGHPVPMQRAGQQQLVVDGWFGTLPTRPLGTPGEAALAVDGAVGPAAAKAFWRPLVVLSEAAHGLSGTTPADHVHRVGYDPGAVG